MEGKTNLPTALNRIKKKPLKPKKRTLKLLLSTKTNLNWPQQQTDKMIKKKLFKKYNPLSLIVHRTPQHIFFNVFTVLFAHLFLQSIYSRQIAFKLKVSLKKKNIIKNNVFFFILKTQHSNTSILWDFHFVLNYLQFTSMKKQFFKYSICKGKVSLSEYLHSLMLF